MLLNNLNIGFLEFVQGFYKGIPANEITLAYEGEMNHQLMKVFTSITLGRMSAENEKQPVRKKVYHVMIECLQNISKHAFNVSEELQADLNHGILIISKNPDNYLITTGNVVEIEQIRYLNQLLEKINTLNKKDLNELYKQQLREGNLSDKGGAGLGFIDIRRKTGQNLEYQFLPINSTHSFFLFTSRIVRNI